jgi:hypothetical protein
MDPFPNGDVSSGWVARAECVLAGRMTVSDDARDNIAPAAMRLPYEGLCMTQHYLFILVSSLGSRKF